MSRKQKKNEFLTTEILRNRYPNHFHLVGSAIKLVKDYIETSRMPRIEVQSQNPAQVILHEMFAGCDYDIKPEELKHKRVAATTTNNELKNIIDKETVKESEGKKREKRSNATLKNT